MQRFEIPFRLPGLNDYISAMNSNRHKGNKLKRQTQADISWFMKNLKPVTGQVVFIFEWHEATRRRDIDNVASAKKFILDALQEVGVLPNDNSRYVVGFSDTFIYDKTDRVIVTIREV